MLTTNALINVTTYKTTNKELKDMTNKEFIQGAVSFMAGVAIVTGVITLNPILALSGALIELLNLYNLTNTKGTKTND